jgi:hypothetical protein
MKKKKRSEILEEMRNLYEVEKLSLMEIGLRFGISRQTVSERFKRAGILLPGAGNFRKKTFEREILVKLYLEEKLSGIETARRLKTTYSTLRKELTRHGIQIRQYGFTKRIYSALYELKVGETVLVKRPDTKNPVTSLHSKATNARMKISVKSVGKDLMEIYRIK